MGPLEIIIIILIYVIGLYVSYQVCHLFQLKRVSLILALITVFFSLYVANFHLLGGISFLLHIQIVSIEFLLSLFLLELVIVIIFFPSPRCRPLRFSLHLFHRVISISRKCPFSKLYLFLFCLLFIACIIVGLSRPPIGYDALWYKLPTADLYYKSKTLVPSVNIPLSYYPGNILLIWLPLMSVSWDNVFNLFQLPFVILCAISIYFVCQSLQISEENSFKVSLLTFFTPVVIFQSIMPLDSLIFSFFIITSFGFLVQYYRDHEVHFLILSGLSMGLAAGSKYIGLYCLMSIFLVIIIYSTSQRISVLRQIRIFVIYLISTLFPSLFWYLRNLFWQGNPIFPFGIKIHDFIIVDGAWIIDSVKQYEFVRSGSSWFFYPLLGRFSHESGLGFLLGIYFYIAVFVIVYFWLRKKSLIGLLISFIVVSLVIWWFLSSREPRFVLAVVLLLYALLGYMLDLVPMKGKNTINYIIMILVVITLGQVFLIFFQNSFELSYVREVNRNEFYGIGDYIDNLEEGSLILNMFGQYQNYPLLGSRRQHYVKEGGKWYEISYEDLRKHKVDYIFFRGKKSVDMAESRISEVYATTIVNQDWYNRDYSIENQTEYIQIFQVY